MKRSSVVTAGSMLAIHGIDFQAMADTTNGQSSGNPEPAYKVTRSTGPQSDWALSAADFTPDAALIQASNNKVTTSDLCRWMVTVTVTPPPNTQEGKFNFYVGSETFEVNGKASLMKLSGAEYVASGYEVLPIKPHPSALPARLVVSVKEGPAVEKDVANSNDEAAWGITMGISGSPDKHTVVTGSASYMGVTANKGASADFEDAGRRVRPQ